MTALDFVFLLLLAVLVIGGIAIAESMRREELRRRRLASLTGTRSAGDMTLQAKIKRAARRFDSLETRVTLAVAVVILLLAAFFRVGVLATVLSLAVCGAACWYGVRAWRIQKLRREFSERFPDAIDSLTRAVQAGVPVEKALATVGETYEGELGRRFRTLVQHIELGFPFREASAAFSESLKMPDVDFFCAVLSLNRETGSRLTPMLISLSRMLRDRRGVNRKIRVMTSETRSAAKLLSILPFVVLAVQFFFNPKAFEFLIYDEAGRFILGVCLCVMIFGIVVINRMSRTGAGK